MSGETGYEQRVAQESGKPVLRVSDAGTPSGLESAMDKCTKDPKTKVLNEGNLLAFRRWGFVYALMVDGTDINLGNLSTDDERKAADSLAERIKSGEIAGEFRVNGPTDRFCISSAPYQPGSNDGKEYDVPESAKWVRARKRKIIFYGNNIPQHKADIEDNRRRYSAVPEGAVKLRRVISKFEWLMPDGSGNYGWKRI